MAHALTILREEHLFLIQKQDQAMSLWGLQWLECLPCSSSDSSANHDTQDLSRWLLQAKGRNRVDDRSVFSIIVVSRPFESTASDLSRKGLEALSPPPILSLILEPSYQSSPENKMLAEKGRPPPPFLPQWKWLHLFPSLTITPI